MQAVTRSAVARTAVRDIDDQDHQAIAIDCARRRAA